jgi:very-short-patch-repair endonuclease
VPSPWTRADLEAAVRRHGRRPGVQNLRLALDRIRYGSLSPQESRLRVELVDAGLPEPALNLRVVHRGTFIAMVDLAYPDHKLAVEYLGDHHRTDDAVYQEDIYRRERLMSAGWNVVFVTAADVRGPIPRAVLSVRRALSIASS